MEESVPHPAPDGAALDLFAAPEPPYVAPWPGADGPPPLHLVRADEEDVPDVAEPESAAALERYVIPGEPLAEPEAPLTPDQLAMFAVEDFTVVLPDEAIRAQYAAAGETPGARKLTYDATTIRQLVLYYDVGEYREILLLLERLMRTTTTRTHTEALTRLLREWGVTHGPDVAR